MPGFLKKEPTLGEMEEQSEQLDSQLDVEEKKALLKKLKEQTGDKESKKWYQDIHSGIDWSAVKFRVK
jgi:hypothetical protein